MVVRAARRRLAAALRAPAPPPRAASADRRGHLHGRSARRRPDRYRRSETSHQVTTSRSLAERFATTLSAHDLDAFAALIHDDYVNHNRYAEPGKAGALAVFAHFLDAFEGFRVEANDMAVDGHTLVGRYPYRGRH